MNIIMHFQILTVLCIIYLADGRGIKTARSHRCSVLDIPLQKKLDLAKFQGKWYGAFKTSSDDSMLSYFMEIYDARIIFTLNDEKNYDLKAYGSKFYGGWCPNGKGHALFPSPGEPEKMTMYFDTRIGRKIGMKPAWLLKTDYVNYAVLFSCWEITSSGVCDPLNTYALILQRKTTPLSSQLRAEVDQALEQACTDPKILKPIQHYGYCTHEGAL